MAVTVDQFWGFLSGTPGATAPGASVGDLQRVLDSAVAVIAPHLLDTINPLPASQQQALDTAQLRVAAELWRWQQANAGSTMYADGQDYPQPVYRDVYYSVQPLLMHAGLVARGMA